MADGPESFLAWTRRHHSGDRTTPHQGDQGPLADARRKAPLPYAPGGRRLEQYLLPLGVWWGLRAPPTLISRLKKWVGTCDAGEGLMSHPGSGPERAEHAPSATRFKPLFVREAPLESARFHPPHAGLAVRLPVRARRAAA